MHSKTDYSPRPAACPTGHRLRRRSLRHPAFAVRVPR